jgi:hypothetical protein
MQRQSYEFVEVSDQNYQLPLKLEQRNPRLSRLPGLALMSALAAAVIGPQIALALTAIASPEIRAILENQPSVAIELALAFVFWTALVCLPLRSMLAAILCRRQVSIADGMIEVVDIAPFSRKTWRAPLASFDGIAHHVRSSLSGVRHEAILVHPDTRRNVILMVAAQIGDPELRELGQVLGLPRVSATRIYRFGGPSGGLTAQPALASATA